MKRVVLIGDSIRMGYQDVVRQTLAAQLGGQNVSVWAPDENGGDSRNVLAHLDAWVFAQCPDVLHINCGLHDIKRPFDSGRLTVPVAEYEANVREILTQVSDSASSPPREKQARGLSSGCHTNHVGRADYVRPVIWATTTPVNGAWHHARKPFDRFEADVRAYNVVAVRVARELGVPINDLFTLVMEAGRDQYLVPDGVHFTGAGYSLLGQAVAGAIARYL